MQYDNTINETAMQLTPTLRYHHLPYFFRVLLTARRGAVRLRARVFRSNPAEPTYQSVVRRTAFAGRHPKPLDSDCRIRELKARCRMAHMIVPHAAAIHQRRSVPRWPNPYAYQQTRAAEKQLLTTMKGSIDRKVNHETSQHVLTPLPSSSARLPSVKTPADLGSPPAIEVMTATKDTAWCSQTSALIGTKRQSLSQ